MTARGIIEYAEGRHADYAPGSSDLDRIVQLMAALTAISVPRNPGLFAAANVRLWDEIANSSDSDWTAAMARAAHDGRHTGTPSDESQKHARALRRAEATAHRLG